MISLSLRLLSLSRPRRCLKTSPPSQARDLLSAAHLANNVTFPRGPFDNPHSSHYATSRGPETKAEDLERLVPFFLSLPANLHTRPVGLLREIVLRALRADHLFQQSEFGKSCWQIGATADSVWAVGFAPWAIKAGRDTMTKHMARLVQDWKEAGKFPDILSGWSDETYPVFVPNDDVSANYNDRIAFGIERAALPLFGLPNFGCLMTGYIISEKTGETMIWVPRRSLRKKTWPGKLDVTVGGGIALGESSRETIIRECAEEALLDTSFVRSHVLPTGVLSIHNRSPAGWLLPGVYYLFDLRLPPTIRPATNPADGEVAGFELMSAREVVENLRKGDFKSSSALALIDFLIRHGLVTDESDRRYVDICLELRKEMVMPYPW